MNMDRKNFENEVFDELPEAIVCSNFKHCTFNVASHFERCNLIACTFTVESTFDRSNIISAEEEAEHEAFEREILEQAEAEK